MRARVWQVWGRVGGAGATSHSPAEPLMMCSMLEDCDWSWLKWDGWSEWNDMECLAEWAVSPWVDTEFKWRAASQDWLMAMAATTYRWLIVFPCKSCDKLINANDTLRPRNKLPSSGCGPPNKLHFKHRCPFPRICGHLQLSLSLYVCVCAIFQNGI